MFATISKNPPDKIGKKFSDLSYFGKSTTAQHGLPEWNLKMETANDRLFKVSSRHRDRSK
jgi:hypothetical protein